jgi:hypothetical protein
MVIHPELQRQLAQARADDLRREAARATAGHPRDRRFHSARPAEPPIVIRPDRPEDQPALARLAGLDCARVPATPLLVAEVAGELRAALSLGDGQTIADPFHRTASLVELLTLRAAQLRGEPTGRRRLLPRLRRREQRPSPDSHAFSTGTVEN